MSRWAYHGTESEHVAGIARDGLLPHVAAAYPESCIYFMDMYRLATGWGDVVLRFPWPDDAEAFGYVGAWRRNWRSQRAVTAALIEVRRAGRWEPLIARSPRRKTRSLAKR